MHFSDWYAKKHKYLIIFAYMVFMADKSKRGHNAVLLNLFAGLELYSPALPFFLLWLSCAYLSLFHCSLNQSAIGFLFIVRFNLFSSSGLFSTLKTSSFTSKFRLCCSE